MRQVRVCVLLVLAALFFTGCNAENKKSIEERQHEAIYEEAISLGYEADREEAITSVERVKEIAPEAYENMMKEKNFTSEDELIEYQEIEQIVDNYRRDKWHEYQNENPEATLENGIEQFLEEFEEHSEELRIKHKK